MNHIIGNVLRWASDRNLIDGGCPKTQTLKCVSKVGALADSVNKQRNIQDDLGDVLVALIILAAQHDLDLEECLHDAYETIKDRKGVMLDGVFIRDSDPSYQGALAVLGARRVISNKEN